MKQYVIPWFDDFECLGADCGFNCCEGWVIPLDEDDINRFKSEKGMSGLKLRLATFGFTREHFNHNSGRCPYLGKDGLCRMQQDRGADFIPWACRNYPRFYRNYGEFEEISLDLSCVRAARLLLDAVDEQIRAESHLKSEEELASEIKPKSKCKFQIKETDGEPHTKPCTSNDDPELLGYLRNQRDEMIEKIWTVFSDKREDIESDKGSAENTEGIAVIDGCSSVRRCGILADALFSYAVELQDGFARLAPVDGIEDFIAVAMDKYTQNSKNEAFPVGSYAFPMPLPDLRRIIQSSLFHQEMSRTNPELYAMLYRADDAIDRYMRSAVYWPEQVEEYCRRRPGLLPALGAYMSYYLYQYYLWVYETYSFRRQISLSLCHTSMILLLAMSEDIIDESQPDSHTWKDKLAQIISCYNRRALFNDEIQDEIHRIFENGWMKMCYKIDHMESNSEIN